jgi:hypothetical protein
MKKLKHLVLTLIQKLKQRQKISQSLNTDNNLRFSKGDRVKVKFVLEIDDIKLDFDYIGFITDINERYVIPSIESSYKIEYRVTGTDLMNKGWYEPKDITSYSLQDEREEKLNQLFGNK